MKDFKLLRGYNKPRTPIVFEDWDQNNIQTAMDRAERRRQAMREQFNRYSESFENQMNELRPIFRVDKSNISLNPNLRTRIKMKFQGLTLWYKCLSLEDKINFKVAIIVYPLFISVLIYMVWDIISKG
jgi:hypothetical protein